MAIWTDEYCDRKHGAIYQQIAWASDCSLIYSDRNLVRLDDGQAQSA